MNFFRKYIYLLFLLIAFIGYWQVGFLVNALKWDAVDVFFPWKYHLGECLQNGIFPFWNPYQMSGFPFHANLQTTLWYPTSLIVGSLFGYSIPALQLLLIFRLSLAGFGLFLLLRHFSGSAVVSFIGGVAYMLSGFFVAHGQHFTIIIAATWIPYVFLFYLKFLKEPKLDSLLKTAFFAFLMITGGYQILSIVTAYLMFISLLISLLKAVKKKEIKRIRKLALFNLGLLIVLVILLIVLIIPTIEVFPLTSRFAEGLTYLQANETPFTPQSIISLFLPLSTVDHFEFFRTDISMNNLYFGGIMFIFFIYNLRFAFRSRKEGFLLPGGIFFLLAAFGKHFPLHKLLFDYIPFFNSFRAPSLVGLFSLLAFVLLAGMGIKRFLENFRSHKKAIAIIASLIAIGYFIAACVAFFQIRSEGLALFPLDEIMANPPVKTSLYQKIFTQSIAQFIVLVAFIFLVTKLTYHNFKPIMVLLIIFEMGLSVQMNLPYTVTSYHSPKNIENKLELLPNGFPIPDDELSITNTQTDINLRPLWRNTATLKKQVDSDAFSSFRLQSYKELDQNYPGLRKAILNNPVVYLPDRIHPLSQLDTMKEQSYHPKDLYVPDKAFDLYSHKNLEGSNDDFIRIESFTPNSIHIKTETQNGRILTYLQANYPGWEVYIDDKPVEHFTSNILFMSVFVPSGKHNVRFEYSNRKVIFGLFISYTGLLVVLALLVIRHFGKKGKVKAYVSVGVILLLGGFIIFRFTGAQSFSEKQEASFKSFSDTIQKWNKTYHKDSITYVCNIDNKAFINDYIGNEPDTNIIHFRFDRPEAKADFNKILKKISTPYLCYIWSNLYNPAGNSLLLAGHYADTLGSVDHGHTQMTLLKKTANPLMVFDLERINDFNKKAPFWDWRPQQCTESPFDKNNRITILDSSHLYSSTFKEDLSDKLNASRFSITIKTHYYYPEKYGKAFAVVSIGNKFYKSFPIPQEKSGTGAWTSVINEVTIPVASSAQSPVKIYIWNKGKATLYINEIGVYVRVLESK